jgi:serine/threonine protein kinase
LCSKNNIVLISFDKSINTMLKDILEKYNLNYSDYEINNHGSGLINKTWKLKEKFGEKVFILQQINKNVFKSPGVVTENIFKLGEFFSSNHSTYLFPSIIPSLTGNFEVKDNEGEFYKLAIFIPNSVTIDTVSNKKQAFEAAWKFAEFTYLLKEFDCATLNSTLLNFHNLSIRFKEFEQQIKLADTARLSEAKLLIEEAFLHKNIVETYEKIVEDNILPLRTIHHDTKISNILFDKQHNGLCVIDLDTVMPGYFISDVGDMLRTYLCPVNEEEKNLDKIEIREEIFEAITEGYFKGMGKILTIAEKELFVYSGKFLIYMQAIRFLTDFLANDVYYGEKYPGHNLVRAKNQMELLKKYLLLENRFEKIVANHKQIVVL